MKPLRLLPETQPLLTQKQCLQREEDPLRAKTSSMLTVRKIKTRMHHVGLPFKLDCVSFCDANKFLGLRLNHHKGMGTVVRA